MPIVFPVLLFVVATAYAAVGLGGGTAYLSVLTFWTTDPDLLRPLAWGLNVVVAAVGSFHFHRNGHFDLKVVWPMLAGGIGGGVIGAVLPIPVLAFRLLLAALLLIVALRMLFSAPPEEKASVDAVPHWAWALLLGLGAGVIAGLVGIGGGVVIGPIVLVLGWLPAKRAAAMTAVFVLLTSAGALAAHASVGGTMPWRAFALPAGIVLVGAWIGARFGAGKASPLLLQRLFGLVVWAASINLIVHLFQGISIRP